MALNVDINVICGQTDSRMWVVASTSHNPIGLNVLLQRWLYFFFLLLKIIRFLEFHLQLRPSDDLRQL
jgi:hypothetical protein